MPEQDQRPSVWVGHIALHTKKIAESCEFMRQVGMRVLMNQENFALLELRGGTHLVLTTDENSSLLRRSFDLMVDDIDASHKEFTDLGLNPDEIERGNIHDSFEITEPGGNVIMFNSSHVGDLPV
ncbi:MAG: glyoxalase/bleomycin resistance/dioxygenase family protein [Pseudomonadota bacterium]